MEKKYQTYLYLFFDESIEEENTSHQCLTKTFGESNSYNGSWLGYCPEMVISQILDTCWCKEDVDLFVKENPECKSLTFSIWKENRNWGEKNWEHYCPLTEQRDKLLKELL